MPNDEERRDMSDVHELDEAGYPVERNLDGVFFRLERDGEWVNVCFSDMTPEERWRAMEGRGTDWLRTLAEAMAYALRRVGDELDVRRV